MNLFRDYPEIVPAFQWVERHQDCLTGSMRVEEFPREDHDGQILTVPIFVVNNNDDFKMLYSNLRVERNFVINFLERNDETQALELHEDDDPYHGGDGNLDGFRDAAAVCQCSSSKCRVTDSSIPLQMCIVCKESSFTAAASRTILPNPTTCKNTT